MISIFNGRKRSLGGGVSSVFAQVGVGFRDYLKHFKGARLGVFLAITLHADENGWAYPSYGALRRETGYNKDTIAKALSDLCELTIEGHRVLLRFQPIQGDGTFTSNRYLIFPSADEVQCYETNVSPYPKKPDTVKPDTVPPDTVKPEPENPDTKKNHPEQEPNKQEPEKEEPTATAAAGSPAAFCSIHRVKMERREKDGQAWYSHRHNGGWCKGAAGDQPGERIDEAEHRRRYISGEYADSILH